MASAQGDWEKLLENRVREVSRGRVILSLTSHGQNWGFYFQYGGSPLKEFMPANGITFSL